MPQAYEGAFVTQCEDCGVPIRQRNMCYVAEGDNLCGWCQNVLAGRDGFFGPPTLNRELGWCGCDDPWRVAEMMRAYLASRVGRDYPKPQPEGVSEDAALLLAYIADNLGWTDHGFSIGGAWLMEDGEAVLARLEELAKEG